MPKVLYYNSIYLLSYVHPRYMKCLFTNMHEQQNMLKVAYFLRKRKTSRVNNSRLRWIKNAKLSGYCFYMNRNIQWNFQICISVPLRTLIKKDWRFKYVISKLSKMASTKGTYGTVIKKLKFTKIMKRILGIIAFTIGLRIFTIGIKQCFVQIVYMCKKISINVCSEIPFSKNPHPKETSLPICFANQLTGFYTRRDLNERYFRTDFRLLLTVMI